MLQISNKKYTYNINIKKNGLTSLLLLLLLLLQKKKKTCQTESSRFRYALYKYRLTQEKGWTLMQSCEHRKCFGLDRWLFLWRKKKKKSTLSLECYQMIQTCIGWLISILSWWFNPWLDISPQQKTKLITSSTCAAWNSLGARLVELPPRTLQVWGTQEPYPSIFRSVRTRIK